MTDSTEPVREPDWPEQDERLWRNWLARGYQRDRASIVRQVTAARWSLAVILIVVALFWGFVPTPNYELAVRSIVALGAACLMIYEFRREKLALAALSGVLCWLYNPVTPLFSFAGSWSGVLLILSSIAFLLPLAGGEEKKAPHV